jgi:hypothetical protein
MTSCDRRLVLVFVILFGFFARAATYKAPFFDHHGWRQSDTASIARNFHRERFNLFYPQIDQRGARDEGYVETGLELFAFLVAAFSLPFGFHHETGRVLSALLFVGSGVLTWSFVRRRYGERHGLAAAFLHAFGFPLLLYIERAFMNEALLIFLSLACLTSSQRYLDAGRRRDLACLLTASTVIGAIKLPYLIVWFPVVGLYLERHGRRAAWRPDLWAMAALNLTGAAAWYLHARRLGARTGLSFGLADKLFDPAIVFTPAFPVWVFDRMFVDVLGPVSFLAAALGFSLCLQARRWCELLGLTGFGLYLVIVAWGNFHHDYYQLAIVPVASSAGAAGVVWLGDRLGGATASRQNTMLAALLALAATSTFVRSVGAHSWYEVRPESVETCRLARELSAPGELVVFIGEDNPQMMFCLDRRGWLISAEDATPARIEAVWNEGARLAVVPAVFEGEETRRLLAERAELLLEQPSTVVYRFLP